jgi:hypothetical protein
MNKGFCKEGFSEICTESKLQYYDNIVIYFRFYSGTVILCIYVIGKKYEIHVDRTYTTMIMRYRWVSRVHRQSHGMYMSRRPNSIDS